MPATLPDLSDMTAQDREELAWMIHERRDFNLPRLQFFNDRPCPAHSVLVFGCRQCGLKLFSHQRVGVGWLYTKPYGLLADETGLGKSAHIAGLIAALKETGELSRKKRTLLVARASSVTQWKRELARMIPDVRKIHANRPRQYRIDDYLDGEWEVCLISDRTLVNDYDMFFKLNLHSLIGDDIDPLRNPGTRAAAAFKNLAKASKRVLVVNATPLQKRLPELHSTMQPIGGDNLLGTLPQFKRKHIREYNGVTSYVRIEELKNTIAPHILRRTAADVDDVEMPLIMPPNNIYLDLTPRQRSVYQQLQRGIIEIIKNGDSRTIHAKAGAAFTYGSMICSGLAAIGEDDGPEASVKLNWLERFAEDAEEKIIAFIGFKGNVAALEKRLANRGIGYASITGDVSKKDREIAQERLFDDPHCKVLIGTQAIEMSLNLQAARHLVNVDTILNPARMTQVAGRYKRVGSRWRTLYLHNLYAFDTQEERYQDRLRKEQAIANAVWNGKSEIFEELSALEKMQLILS